MSRQRADQLVEAGLWLKLSGDTDGARRLFEQAVAMEPGHPKAQQLLAAAGAPAAGGSPRGATPAPAGPASLIEQDWAMATGIIEERKREHSPLPAGSPHPPPAPPDDSNDLPWIEPSANSAPSGAPVTTTLAFGLEPAAPVKPTAPAQSAWDSASASAVVGSAPELGKVMDLVAAPPVTRTPPPVQVKRPLHEEVASLVKGAKDLLNLDDHTGAMDLIRKAEELAPGNAEVVRMRERSEHVLQTMFESKLGALDRHPRVVLKQDEIIWLNLDHRAGFVLAQIDGTVSFEDLFAVSGMSRLDTARILSQLMDEGVIKG